MAPVLPIFAQPESAKRHGTWMSFYSCQ